MTSRFKTVICAICCAFFCIVPLQSTLAAPIQLPTATRARLEALLAAPAWKSAQIGISVRALGTVQNAQQFPAAAYSDSAQPEVFARETERRFIPASNTKSFTAAAALRYLGAEFRFPTRVVAFGTRHQSTLIGDLALIGGGDPSLSSDDVKKLAAQVARTGIRQIRGDIVGDGTAFTAETFGGRYPDGWTLDDAIWYYGMEISALAIDRNQVDVSLSGTRPGAPAQLTVSPELDGDFPIVNRVATSNAKQEDEAHISFERADADNAIAPIITISGRIAPGQTRSEGVAVSDPPRRAALIFARELRRLGVLIRGQVRSGQARLFPFQTLLARHDAPPLKTLLHRVLKASDNLYSEMLLRATAFYPARKPFSGTLARGHQLLFDWLNNSGVESDDLQFTDGSGLSRYNLVTPRASTQMLAAVQTVPDAMAFYEALPIAGVDGTLRNRMQTGLASNNVRAKTGTFSIVSTLSGYVTTADNHRLAVAVLTNFGRGAQMRALQDDIFQTLAQCRLSAP